MKKFIIYNTNDGTILRTGSCAESLFNLQAQEGESILEGEANQLTQMVSNGQLVDKPEEIIPPKPIEQLKTDKSAFLNAACKQAIYEGYTSDALGADYLYPLKPLDQTNMTASVTDSLIPTNPVDWVTPFWCADLNGVWEYRLHTMAQIQKAGSDGKKHIVTQLQKNALLQGLVTQAVTPEELETIVW